MLKLNRISKKLMMLSLLTACGSPTNSSIQEAPDYRNTPSLFGADFQILDEIPSEGYLPDSKAPWSGDYWATQSGGISYRWQSDEYGETYEDFMYDILTEDEVQTLDAEAAAKLSPSEKYDLLMGDTDFTLTRSEKTNVLGSIDPEIEDVPTWFGLCHGWAAAAILESQPQNPVVMKTPEGLEIKFYASDIKALLTKQYASAKIPHKFLGARCYDESSEVDDNGRRLDRRCRDTNPASFHLVIDHYINVLEESFVMDMDGEMEVWNQPVTGYDASLSNKRLLSSALDYPHAAEGTHWLVDVDMRVSYVTESGPSMEGIDPYLTDVSFIYTLELDEEGKIIGGEWISETRPDFLWTLTSRMSSEIVGEIDHKMLEKLVNKSL